MKSNGGLRSDASSLSILSELQQGVEVHSCGRRYSHALQLSILSELQRGSEEELVVAAVNRDVLSAFNSF